jgi:hypothetical protein
MVACTTIMKLTLLENQLEYRRDNGLLIPQNLLPATISMELLHQTTFPVMEVIWPWKA